MGRSTWAGRGAQLYLLRAADRRELTVVFEGKPVGTPDAGTFWRVIEEHGVASFFTATAIRAVKREDEGEEIKRYDLSSLRRISRGSGPIPIP